MRRLRIYLAVAVAAVAISCTDERRDPTSPPNVNLASPSTVDAQIDALFPRGLATVGHARWATIQRQAATNTTVARKNALLLIDWMMKKYEAGVLLDPNGGADPTTERAVGVLTASIFAAAYPSETPPPIDILENNGAIAIIGSEGGTVTAPEENGAVDFPRNTFESEVLVVVQELPQTEPPGDGPLPGPYAQYPGFFEISTFPDTPNNQPVRIAICYELSGPYAPPASAIPGLRIGHERHTVPPTVDILERVDVDDLITCDGGIDEEDIGSYYSRRRVGWVQKGLGLLADAASSAVRVFTPTPLYALHVGVGGELELLDGFSDFGIVSPETGASVCTVTDPGDPSSFNNFSDAVAWTAAGGIIEVCGGTYDATDIFITKTLTIRPKPAVTRPILTQHDTALASFIVDSMFDGGSVTIRGLQFNVNGYSGIFAQGVWDQLRVTNNRFVIFDSSTTSLYAGASTVPGAKVQFDTNAVHGGEVGVFVPGGHADVIYSEFDSTTFSGIQYQNGATGDIAWNTVTNCGEQGCIRARFVSGVNIHHNAVSSPWARRTIWGIIADTGAVIIENNTVTGIGGLGMPTVDTSYAFRRAGIQVGLGLAPTQGAVNRNTMSNAATGMIARNGTVLGSDNVISGVKRGFLTEVSGMLNVTDSDITGYVNPWANAAGSTLTCNWWGSASGPSGIPAAPAGPSYIPWATAPTANAGTGACDGGPVILGAEMAASSAALRGDNMSSALAAPDTKRVRVGQRAAKLRGKTIELY